MAASNRHKWAFAARFRKSAYGWRSSRLAVRRVREAVSEIRKTARRDPVLGAEGAVRFLEKVSPALAHVDSSSGAIGTAVNNAIAVLVPLIAGAGAPDAVVEKWLQRLWRAVEEDDIPYIELLPDRWGELCGTPERASRWADDLIDGVRLVWGPNVEHHGFFKGTSACLSALFAAGRYEELLALLERAPFKMWSYHEWGVKALLAMGRKAEALRYAEASHGRSDHPGFIAEACEKILLSSGMAEEAYRRYAIVANQRTTYLATFRAITKKYPHKPPAEILDDLAASTPGEEGKWFAAARSAGLLDEAITLANRSPCDPKTLTRAARDLKAESPGFALEAGMAALRWLVAGYGYDISGRDVWDAYRHTVEAGAQAGCRQETVERIRRLVAGETFGERFVTRILGRELGLADQRP